MKKSILFVVAFLFINSLLFAKGWKEVSSVKTESISIKLEWNQDQNDFRINADGNKFFKTKMRIEYNDGNGTNKYELSDYIYTNEIIDALMKPCMIIDPNHETVTIFALEKDPDPKQYGMTGYAYILNKNSKSFVKEVVFTQANLGWFSFFGGSDNGNPTLCHFSFAGRVALESKRNSEGKWNHYLLGNIDRDIVTNQWESHKNILITSEANVDKMTGVMPITKRPN